jgi:hypothetical protein
VLDGAGAVSPCGKPCSHDQQAGQGESTLTETPSAHSIVVQAGKWRRQTTLPMVRACQDNCRQVRNSRIRR